jgi:transposase-like protein
MPPPHPPEFRRRAIELARERAKPIAQIAADIGISESCLRTWLHQAHVDEGPVKDCSRARSSRASRRRRTTSPPSRPGPTSSSATSTPK